MAEWSPAQLDRLEDALEDLEQEGGLERWLEDEPGVGDPLRERLTDYRDILVASREALPMEDVPSGLLEGVFEEARRAAAAPAVVVAEKESLWRRLRRSFLVPTVALAGTAALVFWIGRPESQPTTADMPSPESAEAAAAQPVERAKKQRAEEQSVAADADDAKDAERAVAEEPMPEAEAEAKPAPPPPPQSAAPAQTYDEGDLGVKIEGRLGRAEDDKSGADSGRARGQGPAKPTEPTATPGTGSAGRWDLISAGDQARQAGDCVTARQQYAIALEDDEAAVRARAYAGIGLCDAQQGNSAAADSNYERARELDGATIDDFLDSQRDHDPPKTSRPKRAKKKSKPRSKSSSKKAINLDQMSDPFGGL